MSAPPERSFVLTPRNRWRLVGLVVAVLGAYLYSSPSFPSHRVLMIPGFIIGGLGAYFIPRYILRKPFLGLFLFCIYFILYMDITLSTTWQLRGEVIGACVLVLASTGLLLESIVYKARKKPRFR